MTGRGTKVTDGVDRARSRFRATTIGAVALTLGVVIGTAGAVAVNGSFPGTDQSDCNAERSPIRVVVAPELAAAVGTVVQAARANDDSCQLPAQIVSSDPADTAAALDNEVKDRPDVWIPDSSVWVERVMTPGSGLPVNNRHVASSPLVLALPASVAAKMPHRGPVLSVADLLPMTPGVGGPVRWVLPKPDRLAGTVGAILALQSALHTRTDANAMLTTVVRNSSQERTSPVTAAKPDLKLATPVTEQQIYAYNLDHPTDQLVGVYPQNKGFAFDYPFVVLTGNGERRTAAAALLKTLEASEGQRTLSDAGFRTPEGVGGKAVKTAPANAAAQRVTYVPDAKSVDTAENAYSKVLRPSRLLAVIDVSGSMGTEVPGADGATRLNLAAQAAVNGLAVYPDDTAVGLWTFATNLTRTTDYRELAPLSPLGRGADGVSGRERVAKALAQVQVEKGGGTGLYDSVLAAVGKVRQTWDPERVNSVVFITDGGNSDPHGINLQQLLRTLQKENDPRRPVAVFTIAYGPNGDMPSLQKISQAVGGKAYSAPDPRMISQVLQDAIGRRACASGC